jgi:hypothetical protein
MSSKSPQKIDTSKSFEGAIGVSSAIADDNVMIDYEDQHLQPPEIADNASTMPSSPTKAFIAKNSIQRPSPTDAAAGDDKRFQAESQKFFLSRPKSSGRSPKPFAFSVPRPQHAVFTISKASQARSPPTLASESTNDGILDLVRGLHMNVMS